MSQNRKLSMESLEDRQVMTAGLNAMLSTFELNMQNLSAYQSFLNPVQLNDGILEIAGSSNRDYITVKNDDGVIRVDRLANAGSMVIVDLDGNLRDGASYTFDPAEVDEILIDAWGGNDKVINYTSIPSTINGGSGNDYLRGGSGADIINGEAGNDIILGKNGDDQLGGGANNDRIYGSSGDDIIEGGSGRDTVYAGSGDDIVYGESGNDRLYGNNGKDQLFAGTGSDRLYGGNNKDVLISLDNSGADRMTGNSGNDVFWGDSNDIVTDSNSHETKYGKHLIASFDNDADKTLNGDTINPNPQHFMNDAQVLLGKEEVPSGWEDFSSYPLFSEEGPQRTDIDQNGKGDCWLMAGIGTIAHDNPERIQDSVVDFGDGTYGVNLNDEYFRVDGQLAIDSNGNPLYAGLGENDSLWSAVVEKAWAEYRSNVIWGLDAGWTTSVWKAFDGTDTDKEWFGWFSDGDDVLNHINDALNDGKVATILTEMTGTLEDSDQLVNNHYYMVDSVDMDARTVNLVNPHGKGSSNYEITVCADDLYQDISYALGFGGVQTGKI